MFLSPIDRAVEANKLITDNYELDFEAAEVTITALESIRNKTQQSLFDRLSEVDSIGEYEMTLSGSYNQSLRVGISGTMCAVTPDMIRWQEELPVQYVNTELINQVVLNTGITPGQNSCYSLAVGCKLEAGILKIGVGAKFYFHGSNPIKETDFNYYYNYNKNYGENLTIPADMDVLSFNFFYYKWREDFANADYIKKGQITVLKTDNDNYILSQSNPASYLIVTRSGEVIKKNEVSYAASCRKVLTHLTDMSNYQDAIDIYEQVVAKEKEKIREERKIRINKMHIKNKGWYTIELICFKDDYNRGGHKEHWTNWRILAESEMDCYDKAVELAATKGYYWFAAPETCQIQFWGVWTDFAEECLRENGLA